MILLYTVFLFLLGLTKATVSLRARGLERKFVRLAASVAKMLRESEIKPGNSSKVDPCLAAKRTLALGALVEHRDAVEAKYFAWQRWADRLGGWVNTVRDWKGKKLPYTLGAVDLWMLMGLADYLGLGEYCSTLAIVQALAAKFSE